MKNTAFLYVLDGMSDWEPALVIAELNSSLNSLWRRRLFLLCVLSFGRCWTSFSAKRARIN